MRTVWITGGGGFAGRHLARALSERGDRVHSIDRPSAGEAPEGSTALELELADTEAVRGALAATSPDAIVHLAAQSSGALSFREPALTLSNNLDSTLGLLEALRAETAEGARGARLLAIGSCEEYGAPREGELPLREDQPLRPSSPYAVSKAAQTLLCQQYRRAHGLDVLSVRSFTHTGPGQSDRFVFSSWAKQIVELERNGGGAISVGNLEVSRDVSDVRDVTRAYAELLDAEWEHSTVNVCSGRELWLTTGLDILREATRVPVEVEVDPERLRPADVPRFVGDPTRLESMLGWVPSTPPERTLADLLAWWRDRLDESSQDVPSRA